MPAENLERRHDAVLDKYVARCRLADPTTIAHVERDRVFGLDGSTFGRRCGLAASISRLPTLGGKAAAWGAAIMAERPLSDRRQAIDRAIILKAVVDTEVHLHRAHHALVDAGRCMCDASNAIPDGGMRFGSECKETAARASALARLGTPVPISARPPQFSCEEERFPRPRLSGRSAFIEETFGGRCGNEKDAPIAAVRSAALEPRCYN